MLTQQLTVLQNSQKELISCIIHTTNTRVSAQRLSYRLDSDTYHHYNNSNSREELKLSRINVQNWIRNIHQQILALSTAAPAYFPPNAQESNDVHLLSQNLSEMLLLLEQLRNDLKETCNDYCAFITGQYQSINKYISPADIKLFISYPEKPFLLPKIDNNGPEMEANELQNPIIKTIVTEVLYRRQDLHLILDTLRLIDIVSPSLKLIEREISVKMTHNVSSASAMFSMLVKDGGIISGSFSDSSDDSDEEQDLILSSSGNYSKRSLFQRVKNVFLGGGSNSKRIGGGSNGSYQKTATSDDDDDDDDENDNMPREDSDEEEEKLMGGLGVQRLTELNPRKKRVLLVIWTVLALLIFIVLVGILLY